MPKRNPGTPNALSPQPPAIHGGGSNTLPKRIKIQLVNLNLGVLPELRIGDLVVLRPTDEGIVARSPLGSRIGDVAEADLNRLSQVSVMGSSIFDLGLDPPSVVLEVLVS